MITDKTEPQNSSEVQKLETPSLVETRQGVSVLYRNHFLYSKYDPSKAILNIISNLTVPENTLVLVYSPVLWLGLKELLQKLPSTSFIAAIELDNELFSFAENNIPKDLSTEFNNRILFFNSSNDKNYINFIQEKHFRKLQRIDFSAGVSFYKENYDQLAALTQSVIDQYWKNRLTLIKFGRLYSKNLFKNLKMLSAAVPLEKLYNTIDKPLIVLGAGESLDHTIEVLKENRNRFYVICVDAALNPLLENEIKPDAVIAVEGQLAIEKAYIGKPADSGILLIADLVSRQHVPEIVKGPVSFFVSEYSRMKFFDRLDEKGILPPVVPPLGSVGLVAMEIALRLRKDENINIYFSGLDFSFSKGITHAKGTPAHKNILFSVSRLKSIYNFNASFGNGSFYVPSKDNSKMISTKNLESYALLFTDRFVSEKNVYDIGKSGIDLKLPKKDFEEICSAYTEYKSTVDFNLKEINSALSEKISSFLKEEKNALIKLKDLFVNGDESQYRNKSIPLNDEINSLLEAREYLYIHFPDDQSHTNLQSFLNRIRIELDFFLKDLSN